MRTVRLSLVGTVILGLLGGLSSVVLAQSADEGNGGFTLRIVEKLDWNDGPSEPQEGFDEFTMGGSLLFEASDPRLSGIWTTVSNCRGYEPPAPQVCVMSVRVENEGGSWLGWGERTWARSPKSPRHILESTVLEGQGDYAGLTAIVHGYDGVSPPFPEGGVIFDFGLPPMPELLGGMSPDATPTDVTPTPDVTLPGALLFDGFSDPALAQWVGKSEGAHSGEVLDDPVRPGNRVLRLSDVVGAGDVFSQPVAVTPGQEYALCFEYMGSPVAPYGANGAAIGIAEGTPGNHRWLAGTSTIGGIEQDLLVDDGTWQQVWVEFEPEIDGDAVSLFRIMLEDFEEPSGDVWFDDISLVPSDQGC